MPRVRKVRRPSEDELALWRRFAATVQPRRPAEPAAEAAGRPEPRPEPAVAPVPPVPLSTRADVRTREVPGQPQMDRRRFERLRRGRLEPEARLDLHGMTSERAHAALTRFVLDARASGRRLVLVITGKGREGPTDAIAPHRHGVLRHSVPHWLAAPPLAGHVLDVVPAHPRHGGAGACYVYLRRSRG